jgi:AcrR family transcriptional regulator
MNIHSASPMPTSPTKSAQPAGLPARSPAARPSQANVPTGSKAGDKHEAIVAAALDLFVERGFYGTTVPEIAERAGVGAGTIYRYFESKESLVNELYREQKQQFAREVIDDFPAGAPSRDLFRVLWHRMADYASAHPKSFIFMELHHHARYLDVESRALEQRMVDLTSALIGTAQMRGDLKAAKPRMLIGLVMGAFCGVIRNCLEEEVPLQSADWNLAERCMWEAIRG